MDEEAFKKELKRMNDDLIAHIAEMDAQDARRRLTGFGDLKPEHRLGLGLSACAGILFLVMIAFGLGYPLWFIAATVFGRPM